MNFTITNSTPSAQTNADAPYFLEHVLDGLNATDRALIDGDIASWAEPAWEVWTKVEHAVANEFYKNGRWLKRYSISIDPDSVS